MTTPSPHGFYSEIHSNQVLPYDVQSHLTKVVDHLHRIENELDAPSVDPDKLAEELVGYDHSHTNFLKELNRNSNRGFEKGVKDAFESVHNRFTDELNDIVDDHETSLRDILMSYDGKKTSHFIQGLTRSSQGSQSLNKLKYLIRDFSKEIILIFNVHK